jgi:hypothetical protein
MCDEVRKLILEQLSNEEDDIQKNRYCRDY